MIVKHTVAKVLIAFLFTVFFFAGSNTASAKICEAQSFHEFNCPFIANPGSDDDSDDDASEHDSGEDRIFIPYPGEEEAEADAEEDDTPRRR